MSVIIDGRRSKMESVSSGLDNHISITSGLQNEVVMTYHCQISSDESKRDTVFRPEMVVFEACIIDRRDPYEAWVMYVAGMVMSPGAS